MRIITALVFAFVSIHLLLAQALAPVAPPVAPQPAVADPAAQSPTLAQVVAPAPAAAPVTPVQPAPAAAPNGSTAPATNLAADLMTCSLPHTFSPTEVQTMSQVLTILILLLQIMIHLNPDKSQEQANYTALLPIYREAVKLMQNIK